MTIEQRLLRVESELRRWRILALCAVAGFVLLIVGLSVLGNGASSAALAAEQPKTLDKLRVESLEIVNKNGEQVGAFEASGETGAILYVGTPKGKLGAGAVISTQDDNVSLLASSAKALTGLSPDGFSIFKVNSEKLQRKKQAIDKTTRGEQLTEQELKELTGHTFDDLPVVHLGIDKLGGGDIAIASSLGKQVVEIQSTKTNAGGIFLGDANGTLRKTITAD